ncbi:MAG: Lysyl endopeptidase [Bacteroidetes bacterium]|nr:MAG: Lysyl endopeptidase [Bacteroidota bacterium]
MHQKSLFWICILLMTQLLTTGLYAQITVEGTPIQLERTFSDDAVVVGWDNQKYQSLDKRSTDLPLVGITQQVDINTVDNGYWVLDQLSGVKIWVMNIQINDVKESTLYFKTFEPGANGRMFILSADNSNIKGAYTEASRTKGLPFSIGPLPGGKLILQFETSIDASDYQIQLDEIGLLKSAKSEMGYGTSGNCEVNVNCAEGIDWQRQKRGVARIVVKQGSALYYCSGSLINNAKKDAAPYFITANHCGEYASTNDYAQWIFAFNYETPECVRPIIEPVSQTITGATLVSKAVDGTENGSDFKLLRLLQDVPQTYNPYFNGWSRQSISSSSGVGIHHPDGDVKKISTYTNPTVSSDYGMSGTNPNGKYWRMRWSATENGHGVTEGGSSGSPLFDASGRIIGMLTGGSSSCNDLNSPDYYGKFSYSWDSNGTEAFNQLAPWLDPDDTGIEFLGDLGSDTLYVSADFETKRTELSINQFIEFEDLSSGKISSYEWHFEGGKPASSTDKVPNPVLYEYYGDFDVQLVVYNETTSDTLLRENYISVKPFLFPNPGPGNFELAFGVDVSEDVEISIMDAFGREVAFYATVNNSRVSISLQEPNRGLYILRINDKFVEKTLKLQIVR